MNYETNILQQYTIQSSLLVHGSFTFFYSDGSLEVVTDTDFVEQSSTTLEELMYYGANYSNRFLQSEHGGSLVSFAYCESQTTAKQLIFCHTDRLEYAVFGSNIGVGTLQGLQFLESEGDTLDEMSGIDNYYNPHGYNPFSDFNDEGSLYGYYSIGLTLQNGYAVFDYSNINYENVVSPYLPIRGENMNFYTYVNDLSWTNVPTYITFAYGAPTKQAYNEGRQNGYQDGYQAGWVNGQQYGYDQGVHSGGLDKPTADAFTYLGKAFEVVDNVLSIQVLPNITLGLCFSIPLTVVIITVLFKLMRK